MFLPHRAIIRGVLLTNTFNRNAQGFCKKVHSPCEHKLKFIKASTVQHIGTLH
jgi:hypothetical protein